MMAGLYLHTAARETSIWRRGWRWRWRGWCTLWTFSAGACIAAAVATDWGRPLASTSGASTTTVAAWTARHNMTMPGWSLTPVKQESNSTYHLLGNFDQINVEWAKVTVYYGLTRENNSMAQLIRYFTARIGTVKWEKLLFLSNS